MQNRETVPSVENTSRRSLLLGAAAAATAVVASKSAIAADNGHAHHKHHNHGAMGQANQEIIDTAMHCIKTGEACLDHCIMLIKDGDTEMAKCLETVTEMLPMCTALSKLATYQSKHLVALAKVCIDVCKDCKKECDKHKDKHDTCKACAESCDECIKACEKIVA